jgi:hypothetical protein
MPVLDDPLGRVNDLPGNGTGTRQIESSDAANGGGVMWRSAALARC